MHLHTATDVTERNVNRIALESAKANREDLLREKSLNEELAAINEELNSTNEELQQAQQSLHELNETLEDRVESRTRKLTESQQKLEQAIETGKTGTWSINPINLKVTMSDFIKELCGFPLDQEIAMEAIVEAIHPDYRNMVTNALSNAINNRLPNDTEYPITNLITRENKWIRATGRVFYDTHGALTEYSGMLIDTTEQVNARLTLERIIAEKTDLEKTLRQNQQRLQSILDTSTFMDVTNRRKLMQQKDEFISVASHELKTPLTTLKASMQLLDRMKENPSPGMLSRLISRSNKSLEKLNSLVGDLLNVNRITQGQLQLRKTTFILPDLVDDCCSHIRSSGTHHITLQGDMELQIHADEQQIDQVLVNLVNNAVKYAPGSKEITITITKLEDTAKIAITDHGPGVLPEKIPHLFDRYYRADYSGLQFSGLGLGLYICAEIIKKHGGEIGVDSVVNKGSTFWFTLPL